LADAVAVVSIERLVATQDVDRSLPPASVTVECAAAMTDRKEALTTLARRLENLTFVASAEALAEALDIFRILQAIDEDLAPSWARSRDTTTWTPSNRSHVSTRRETGTAVICPTGCLANFVSSARAKNISLPSRTPGVPRSIAALAPLVKVTRVGDLTPARNAASLP
jgi:hypothetical protein